MTSTGTPSLDDLLGGFAGLPLGASLLLGESGTTDNASTLLRCYAAEGLLQGHVVHVIGVSRDWIHLLPGLVGPADGESRSQSARLGPLDEANMEKHEEQMKIAWRYERYGGRRGACHRPLIGVSETVRISRSGHDWINDELLQRSIRFATSHG